MSWKMSWKNRLPVISIISLGALLRLVFLGKNDLWYDELGTIRNAEMLSITWNPPLYPFIMNIWVKLTGFSEWTLRFPSAVFSIASLVVMYNLSKKIFDKKTALIGLLLLAINPLHLWYAQEARNYTLVLLLGLLSTYFLYVFVKENRSSALLSYCIFSILGIYSSYFFLFFFASQLIYIIFFSESSYRTKLIFFCPLISFLPWIFRFATKFMYISKGFWIPQPHPKQLLISLENFILGYNGTRILYLMSDFFLVLLLVLIITSRQKILVETKKIALCAILFLLPVFTVYIFSILLFPIYIDRIFLVSTPYFYILLALAISAISNRLFKNIMLSVIISLCLISSHRYFSNKIYSPDDFTHHIGVIAKKPFKPLARFIFQNVGKESCIIIGNQSILPLIYYMSGQKNHYNPSMPWFFVYDADIIDEKSKRVFKESIRHKAYIDKKKLSIIIKPFKKVFFVGGNWLRDGTLESNSKSIKTALDVQMYCNKVTDFDGLKLFVYGEKNTTY